MHILSGLSSKKLHASILASFAAAVVFAAAGPANAEVVELLDKTKMNAKIVHYYDGVYTVEAQGGAVKIPRSKPKAAP
jgi:hypothetical protein